MRKLILIAFFTAFLLIQNAYATEYDKTVWKDWCFIDYPSNFTNYYYYMAWIDNFLDPPSYQIVYLNSKYVVLWLGLTHSWVYPYQATLITEIYNESCLREDRQIGAMFYTYLGNYKINFGNDVLVFNNRYYIPYVAVAYFWGGVASIFSVGNYWSANEPDFETNQNVLTISSPLNKTYYQDLYNNYTFAVGYKIKDGSLYIRYDFYDLVNDEVKVSNVKYINFSNGLSDVNKFYIIPTYGRCFYWNDCLFHILFEGRSDQNNNRYGIYVREIHYNAVSQNYEFKDKGMIGFNESTGFINGQMNVINWFYTQRFSDKIYILSKEGNGEIYSRKFRALAFSLPDYVILRNQVINYYDNNALVSYASGTYSLAVSCGANGCVSSKTYPNVYVGNINNKTIVTGELNATNCSVEIGFYKNGNLVNKVTASARGSSSQPYVTSPIFSIVDLISPGYYDIGIQINCDAYGEGYIEFNLDIFNSNSFFVPTESNISNVESFSLFPTAYGTNKLMLQFPSTTIPPYPTTATIVAPPSEFLNLIPLLLGNPIFFVAIFALAVAAKVESALKAGGYAFVLSFLGIIFAYALFSGIIPWWLLVLLFVLIIGGMLYFKGK